MREITLFEAAIKGADVLVHFGAGKGVEAGVFHALRGDAPTTLVEADPRVAIELKKRTRRLRGVSVMNVAVSEKAGERVLNVFNLRSRSSLKKPADLKRLYPGLRIVEEITVKARAAADVLREIDPSENCTFTLIVETPGEEQAVLNSVFANGLADRCQYIILRCARNALYEGSSRMEELRGLIEEQGANHVSSSMGRDPEFVESLFDLNAGKADRKRLVDVQSELDSAVQERELREADLRELQERYAKLRDTGERQNALLLELVQRLHGVEGRLKELAAKKGAEGKLARELLIALGSVASE